MPTISIDKNQQQFEIAATYLAFLAYPGMPDEDYDRDIFAAALCREAIHVIAAGDADWARTPQLIRPMLVITDPKIIDKGQKEGRKILKKRLEAARVARPFIEEASGTVEHPLPKEIERLSVSQVTEFVVAHPPSSEGDPDNLERRIWRPALPVIHLASALEFGMGKFEKLHGRTPNHIEVLLIDGFIHAIIDHAQRIEDVLPKITSIKLSPEKFVRLRLA